MAIATLTPREVAELAGAPKRLVEKAIEDGVLSTRRAKAHGSARARALLPPYAVGYTALISKLDVTLSTAQKRKLLKKLAGLSAEEIRSARVELAPAVELDIGRLVGDAMDRAERYRAARDKFIVVDEEIMGGTPVIRGTRITVYSVLGQVDHGDTIDLILGDNPDIAREAVEAAIIYARTHPFVPRPGGRPWVKVA